MPESIDFGQRKAVNRIGHHYHHGMMALAPIVGLGWLRAGLGPLLHLRGRLILFFLVIVCCPSNADLDETAYVREQLNALARGDDSAVDRLRQMGDNAASLMLDVLLPGTSPQHNRIAELIRQLGHPDWSEREEATQAILEMGGCVALFVEEQVTRESAETRTRAQLIVNQIRRDRPDDIAFRPGALDAAFDALIADDESLHQLQRRILSALQQGAARSERSTFLPVFLDPILRRGDRELIAPFAAFIRQDDGLALALMDRVYRVGDPVNCLDLTLAGLASESPRVVQISIRSLPNRLLPAYRAQLHDLLTADHRSIRIAAASRLVRNEQDDDALALLLKALRDSDQWLEQSDLLAAISQSAYAGQPLLPEIGEAILPIVDEGFTRRAEAMTALSRFSGQKVVETIVKCLDDDHRSVVDALDDVAEQYPDPAVLLARVQDYAAARKAAGQPDSVHLVQMIARLEARANAIRSAARTVESDKSRKSTKNIPNNR